ncbi:Hvo_1808 family surface protein [Salarchaeum sp. JOR-1]|uniref:Hvo_1808 family surface protein n=1 Tax=Salarchaeum sp. JOR-1 TaxID=2599399 RepID=UPI001198378D|nr:Hvo_1808 family surface protein [Salarchaeum sp. JOR-1]QDX40055.1 hypothetical protein FQU85_03775 [Salarchaeum sp. JOR-1]
MDRRLLAVALVAMVALAGCQSPFSSEATTPAPTGTDATTTHPTNTDGTTTDEYADPETDRLGWEGGRWYDEPVQVDRSDGLNDTELAAVVNRSMARVEQIRELEFERAVPVSIITRAEFRNQTRSGGEPPRNASLHQNVKWEAVFMTGENESAIAAQRSNTAGSVGGYYSPSEDRIVIVSDSENPQMNEVTLAQELFHALQDQRFNITRYDQSTTESHNAIDGIIEGDGNYVDYLYEQRCTDDWNCLLPQSSGGGGSAADLHVGMYAITFQPYSDGPPFVQQLRERGGWEAVNAVYENPPASTEQTIHPATYGEDAPTEVTVADTSTAEWSVPELGPNSVDYAEFGEAGMYVALWYQSYVASNEASAPRTVAVPYRDFFSASGELDAYNYAHEMTAGWDGDKLVPYVREGSAETNETGYVWKSVWDSPQDAQEFVEGYRAVLDHLGATEVSANTYRIPDGKYADAFSIQVSGNTVTIVNAPTVGELDDVHETA